ncbi:hypothetical protein PROFUN_06766 [Planoprotostelium fungivorum]|uniref:Uncharacterized protein n=1 Tax=Planoprotostelium fungivorum TaxID=1890364 RepID=A0A2P6NNJ9_9EUKA|nr:hypothetical protein PROFUN_06766 [Planoprotostelium fungivorum]
MLNFIVRLVNSMGTQALAHKLAEQPWFRRAAIRFHVGEVLAENSEQFKHFVFKGVQKIEDKFKK